MNHPSPPDPSSPPPHRSDNPLPFAPAPERRVSWLLIGAAVLGLVLAISVLYGISAFVLRRVASAVADSEEPTETPPDASAMLHASKNASLVVASIPPRATVRLGNEVVGETPLGLSDLAAGPHIVTLELAGYGAFTKTVDLREGEVENLEVTLTSTSAPPPSARGYLSLSTTPSGAKVFFEGELLGTSPLTNVQVPAGIVRLELELPAGERVSRAVFVQPSQETRTHLPLLDAPNP